MESSRFVQINDYCLIEYVYTSLTSPEKYNTAEAGFFQIVNGHIQEVQNSNNNASVDITGNVHDRSVVQISGTEFAHLDIDKVTPYIDTDSEVTDTVDLPIVFSPNIDVPYDTVKFHLLSGYTFEDLDGVIFQITGLEREGFRNAILAQVALLRDDTYPKLNPKPIFLGDRLYDRYVEIKIPSLKLITEEYEALEGTPGADGTIAALLTDGGKGFIRNNPLNINVIEIEKTTIVNRQEIYKKGFEYSTSIKQADEFTLLAATIQKSEEGDYFEYFPTYDGAFAEDFIANLNSMGNNYILIHELSVLEQIGNSFIETSNFASIQTSGFDQPNLFRPILLNTDVAVSFSIDYKLRFLNKKDSSQLIRMASLSSYDVSTYGKELKKINLKNDPEPQKVYNKLVDGPTINPIVIENANNGKVQTKFVPSFFDKKLVSTRKENLFMGTDGQLKSSKGDQDVTIFSQGQANIVIDPFDTFVKFIIFGSDNLENSPLPMDLGNNATYQLVFIDNNDEKVYLNQVVNREVADQSKGELLFKVPTTESTRILKFINREFFVISVDPESVETKIYQGNFYTPAEMDELLAKEKEMDEAQKAATDVKIEEIQTKQTDMETKNSANQSQTGFANTKEIRQSGKFKAKRFEIPGTIQSFGTKSPVIRVKPNQEVLKSKSDKYQKKRIEDKDKNS